MKNIFILISITVVVIAVFALLSSTKNKDSSSVKSESSSAVTQEGDIQIVNVTSTSGGYYPSSITAKANTETVLRIESKNSYGCERSFRIPKLNITEILPQQGTTDINLGAPQKGENILGSCSMGMYTFTINFE